MYKFFVEEFEFVSDLKHRLNLFFSLFRNKDTISALLWIIGVSIIFFSLVNTIGFYILFLLPAILGLYLLVAYQFFLSFIIFKINAFNAQRQFKDKSSGYFFKYISTFLSTESKLLTEAFEKLLTSALSALNFRVNGF